MVDTTDETHASGDVEEGAWGADVAGRPHHAQQHLVAIDGACTEIEDGLEPQQIRRR